MSLKGHRRVDRTSCAGTTISAYAGFLRNDLSGLSRLEPHFYSVAEAATVRRLLLPTEGEASGRAALGATAWMLGRHLSDDEREPVRVADGHLDQTPGLSLGLGIYGNALLGQALVGRGDVADL